VAVRAVAGRRHVDHAGIDRAADALTGFRTGVLAEAQARFAAAVRKCAEATGAKPTLATLRIVRARKRAGAIEATSAREQNCDDGGPHHRLPLYCTRWPHRLSLWWVVNPASQRSRHLQPGGKLGKYEVIRQIAIGGMAELYLARTSGIEGFEKLVVVKR